jgi:hypothetical protein
MYRLDLPQLDQEIAELTGWQMVQKFSSILLDVLITRLEIVLQLVVEQ